MFEYPEVAESLEPADNIRKNGRTRLGAFVGLMLVQYLAFLHIIPKFSAMYIGMGIELPMATRWAIGLTSPLSYILFACIILLLIAKEFFSKQYHRNHRINLAAFLLFELFYVLALIFVFLPLLTIPESQ